MPKWETRMIHRETLGVSLNSDRLRNDVPESAAADQPRWYTDKMRGLAEAAIVVNSAMSFDDVMQVITDQARAVIGAHQAVTSFTLDQNWSQAINGLSLSDKYEGEFTNEDEILLTQLSQMAAVALEL